MIDRRFDLRVPIADTVLLSWTDHTGQELEGAADMADISASGTSIRVQRPVKLATAVRIVYQDQKFAGKVRSCVAGDTSYLLGIEFDAGYRWSPNSRK